MITNEQRQHFADHGFVHVPGVLRVEDFAAVREEFAHLLRERATDWARRGLVSPDAIDRLRGDFEVDLELLARDPGFANGLLAELDICLPHAPFSAIQPGSPFHVGPGLLDLMTTPALLDVVADFVGPEITASGNQHVRLKPSDAPASSGGPVGRSLADAGAATPWHTDGSTMVEESLNTPIVTVWIAMHDVGEDDGCLLFVPGGHATPDSVPWPTPPSLSDALDAAAVRVPVRRGDVIVLDKHAPHASAPNLSGRIRWSFDLRYFASDQPGDRPWFPSVVVRSKVAPETVMSCGDEWRALWERARTDLAASGRPLPGRPAYARAVAEAHLRRWSAGKYD